MRLRPWIGLAAVIAIAAGSVIGALLVHSNDNAEFERLQRQEAMRSARQAEEVANLSIGQLANAAAFYSLQKSLSRHEFKVFARSLLRESALNATGLSRSRGDCCPLTRVSAMGPAGVKRGFDLDSNPQHALAIRKARDSGRAAATSVGPALIGKRPGMVVYLPIYRDGSPRGTRAARRAALTGFAAGALSGSDLAAAATSALPGNIETQLLENGRPVVGPPARITDGAAAAVNIADRDWVLVVRDPARPSLGLPLLMAVFGVSIAALLGALVLLLRRSEQMQELQRQADQDPLTGLKNRRRFEEDLHTELARSRRDGVSGAMLMLDIDNFKVVNDTHGHATGDRVIEETANVLRRRTRETDVLARLGGDEFAIVLPRCNVRQAEHVAGEITKAIHKRVPLDGEPSITASVGIAMFGPGTDTNPKPVMAEADAAMYRAKEAGRNTVRTGSRENGSGGGQAVAQAQDAAGRRFEGGA